MWILWESECLYFQTNEDIFIYSVLIVYLFAIVLQCLNTKNVIYFLNNLKWSILWLIAWITALIEWLDTLYHLFRLPEGFTQLLSLSELYLNDTFLDYLPGSFGR